MAQIGEQPAGDYEQSYFSMVSTAAGMVVACVAGKQVEF
jgi:hypothetical protein